MKQHMSKGRVEHIDSLISKRLRMRRIILGYSQQELGKAINVSVQQIQKYENAINRISSGKLYGIATFLNVPINSFFESKKELNENAKDNADRDFECEEDVLSIIKLFREIKNAQIRKKVIELVKVTSVLN